MMHSPWRHRDDRSVPAGLASPLIFAGFWCQSVTVKTERQTDIHMSSCILLQVVLNPTTNGPKQAELHRMVVSKNSQDTDLKIKLAVRMDKPASMKHSG